MAEPKFSGRMADYFRTLDAKKKRNLILFGGAAVFLAVLALAIEGSNDEKPKAQPSEKKFEYSILGRHNPREVSIDGVAGRLKNLDKEVSTIKQQYTQQEQKLQETLNLIRAKSEELNQKSEQLAQQQQALSKKLEESKAALDVPLPEVPGKSGKPAPASGPQPATPPGMESEGEVGGLKIRVVTSAGPQGDAKDGKKKEKTDPGAHKIKESINSPDRDRQGNKIDPILPAGSILSGTLITGLDAPSSNQARRDPFPALLRVKHEAILPNRYRMDIRECFLIAGGFGDLSSERAYMRAESLSCVKNDGSIIDVTMDAYAVGEDGKAGVRGRVVSKNGQIIANSLLSGFIAGVGRAFVPQRIQPLNINPTSGSAQGYQYPSPEMIGGQALAGGVRGAAEQIAEYYLEMAKNIFPVIEIDAGRKVDFIMIRGVSLKSGMGASAIRAASQPQSLNGFGGGGVPGRNSNTGFGGAGGLQSLLPGNGAILNNTNQPLLR